MLETKTREQAKVGNKRKGQKVNDVSEKKSQKTLSLPKYIGLY